MFDRFIPRARQVVVLAQDERTLRIDGPYIVGDG